MTKSRVATDYLLRCVSSRTMNRPNKKQRKRGWKQNKNSRTWIDRSDESWLSTSSPYRPLSKQHLNDRPRVQIAQQRRLTLSAHFAPGYWKTLLVNPPHSGGCQQDNCIFFTSSPITTSVALHVFFYYQILPNQQEIDSE